MKRIGHWLDNWLQDFRRGLIAGFGKLWYG